MSCAPCKGGRLLQFLHESPRPRRAWSASERTQLLWQSLDRRVRSRSLAAEGVVFDQHFADTVDAAEVRRVWRTGRLAGPGADLLACLRQRGIASHLIVDASRAAPPHGEGWDGVEIVEEQEDQTPLETTLTAVQAALDDLKQHDNWLLWIELATLLPPWQPPEEYQTPYFEDEPASAAEDEDEDSEREPLTPISQVMEGTIDPEDDELFVRLQSSYAAALTYLDGGIGRILDHLEDRLEQTLIVVTTDIGQRSANTASSAWRTYMRRTFTYRC